MLSYHSNPAVKARYLARVEGHADADEIIKGRYWEAGKGCAVGCTIHGASHADFERELGIPLMLAWLEDVIFEGLPNRAAKTWPQRFLSCIEPGRDLSRVGWRLLHWLLTESGFTGCDQPDVRDTVERCAAVVAPMAVGRPAGKDAAEHAAATARAAAERAGSSHLLQSAWIVESAALAAESVALATAASATLSAERAATAVSAAVGRSADYVIVSEKLLDLLKAA